MPELALPDHYQGAEPTLEIVPVNPQDAAIGTATWTVYNGLANFYYRPRYLFISGRQIGGTMGALNMSFYAYQDGNVAMDLPAAIDNPFNDALRAFTWTTEAGNAYSNFDSLLSGKAAVMGMPLVTLKGPVLFELDAGSTGGGDGAWRMDGGFFHVERFPSLGASGGTATADLYLLPNLG